MFRAITAGLVLASLAFGVSCTSLGAEENRSKGKGFGIGAQVTSPFMPPNAFPASGLSFRLWVADLIGLEVDAFLFEGAPCYSPRAFVKMLNTEIVDIYLGGGLSIFTHIGQGKKLLFTPLQALSGIEIRLTPNIALNAEVGFFGHSGKPKGVTSGMGLHFYF